MVRHCCMKWRKTKLDAKDNRGFLVSIINSLFCLNVTFGSKLFKSVWFNLKWFANMAYYLTHHSQHIMSTLWTNEFDNWCVKPYRLTPSFNFLSYGETQLAKFMLCSCYISIRALPNTCITNLQHIVVFRLHLLMAFQNVTIIDRSKQSIIH